MQYDCGGKTRSVYIHWPFCPYRCRYCPFVAFAGHDDYMPVYNNALKNEIELFSRVLKSKPVLETLYIGGGTPSTWPPSLLLDTFGTLNNVFVFEKNAEITLEVNPGTVTKEALAVWKACGINRLSVGVQSLNDEVLKKLGRFHTAAQVNDFFSLLDGSFNNISIDLIIGLPGIDAKAWQQQLEVIVTWPIQHVSLYFLTVHEHTRLYADLQRGQYVLPDEDEMLSMYEETISFLEKHKIFQYELSNCAKSGFESRHNKVYWSRKPYKGFGLSASSFDGMRRFTTTSNLTEYTERMHQGGAVTTQEELLTSEQIRLEEVMLRLRQKSGVEREYFLKGHSAEECQHIERQLALFMKEGLLEEKAGRIVATLRGFMLENHIVSSLMK